MGRFVKAVSMAYGIVRLLVSLIGFAMYIQYLKLRARIKRWTNKRAFNKWLKGIPSDLRQELTEAYGEALKETVKVPGPVQLISLLKRGSR